MPTGLRRLHHTGDLHAITVSCFRKRPIFATAEPRDTLLTILDGTRQRYAFQVVAYVIMPTHLHLLLSEPEQAPLSTAIQVVKQRFSRARHFDEHVWEPRYFDFNVYSGRKLTDQIDYIHFNPVHAGLALTPANWRWSSYRAYTYNEPGPVLVTKF